MRKYWLYLIIIVQIAIVTSLIRSVVSTLSSSKRLDDLKDRKQLLIDKKTQLADKISQLDSEYYVEKVAREQLHLVKEGEIVVMLPEEKLGDEDNVQPEEVDDLPNYRKWLEVFHIDY